MAEDLWIEKEIQLEEQQKVLELRKNRNRLLNYMNRRHSLPPNFKFVFLIETPGADAGI